MIPSSFLPSPLPSVSDAGCIQEKDDYLIRV
jgi:hypothetical protein